jgi:asparagine synthase (glutamine-hydrolysing)
MSGFKGWFAPSAELPASPFGVEPLAPPERQSPAWAACPPINRASGSRIATQGRTTIAFDGELLGVQALSHALGLGQADPAAMVIAAWQRWPEDFAFRLAGTFAFALHTGDELLLYRDPSGLQDLYWCDAGAKGLRFATDPRELCTRPEGGRPSVSRRSLHEYLRLLDIAAPNSWYEGVQALEPGRLLRRDGPGGRISRSPATHPPPPIVIGLAAAVDELDALLHRSVEQCLADEARPAGFLSGGIDSSLICALSSRHRRETQALTVGFEGTGYDESTVAARIAAHLGMEHRALRFSRADYLRAFDRMCESLDQPMADPAMLATLLAFEYCADRFDVVLDGTGADEALGAMPPRHVRLAVGHAALLPPKVRRGLVHLMRGWSPLAAYTPILDFEHPADMLARWRGFTRPEIEALCGEPVSLEHTTFYGTFARFPRRAHFERSSALLDAMPSDRLNQSMLATGVRLRVPFWDAATQAFLRKLPTEYRWSPGQPKRLLRELLSRYLPRPLWDHPKHGFDFPLNAFLRGDDCELVHRHVAASDIWRRTGLLDPELVRRCAAQFVAGDDRSTFRIWALVVLGAWLQAHP